MDIAYDKRRNEIVLASASDIRERRYVCYFCENPVIYVPAWGNKAPYFKHRAKNMGTACGAYIHGLLNNPSTLFKPGENIFFSYESKEKNVYFTVRLTPKEIRLCEKMKLRYKVGSAEKRAFGSWPVKEEFFDQGINKIRIAVAAETYLYRLYSDEHRKKGKAEKTNRVFRNGQTAFFKIKGDNLKDFAAMLVEKDILYTDTPYFILSSDRDYFAGDAGRPSKSIMLLSRKEKIQIGKKELTGFACSFKAADENLNDALDYYGYKLKRRPSGRQNTDSV